MGHSNQAGQATHAYKKIYEYTGNKTTLECPHRPAHWKRHIRRRGFAVYGIRFNDSNVEKREKRIVKDWMNNKWGSLEIEKTEGQWWRKGENGTKKEWKIGILNDEVRWQRKPKRKWRGKSKKTNISHLTKWKNWDVELWPAQKNLLIHKKVSVLDRRMSAYNKIKIYR